ncbi:MAG: dihydrofolate reductase [Verrucomicrobiae bacterium]|nr:dihydrofolate reductase [Verrucomicrobiae bacterium]
MKIVLIAALARDRTIGLNGKIPWHLPADLRRFKNLTMGHPVIMGRKTWESIGRPLPGRRNLVLTRTCRNLPGAECYPSLADALHAAGDATVFVIGGAEVYAAALPVADELYLTLVPHAGGGDAKFPEFNPADWIETHRERHPDHEFVMLRRVQSANAASRSSCASEARSAA